MSKPLLLLLQYKCFFVCENVWGFEWCQLARNLKVVCANLSQLVSNLPADRETLVQQCKYEGLLTGQYLYNIKRHWQQFIHNWIVILFLVAKNFRVLFFKLYLTMCVKPVVQKSLYIFPVTYDIFDTVYSANTVKSDCNIYLYFFSEGLNMWSWLMVYLKPLILKAKEI